MSYFLDPFCTRGSSKIKTTVQTYEVLFLLCCFEFCSLVSRAISSGLPLRCCNIPLRDEEPCFPRHQLRLRDFQQQAQYYCEKKSIIYNDDYILQRFLVEIKEREHILTVFLMFL